jgi:hypothetical protein
LGGYEHKVGGWAKIEKDSYLLSELSKKEFLKIRNVGEKCWQEFVTLRGY